MYGREKRKFKKKLGSISGVISDVLMNEIKKSYRFLAKAYPPDLNHDERESGK